MSKLLQTQLPIASDTVTSDVFNRLVRILEINLGAVDLDNVRQISDAENVTSPADVVDRIGVMSLKKPPVSI